MAQEVFHGRSSSEFQPGVQVGGGSADDGGGLSVSQAARELGIRESVFGRWKKQLAEDPEEAFPGKGRLKSQDEELRRLRRENEILRQERDILKKAVGIFSRVGPVRFFV
ncbi:MAG: transposase [Pseudomonadota bacterium]